ncbi:MAG: cytochrome b561 domain-containing protein [Pseudomonadota bacterium]
MIEWLLGPIDPSRAHEVGLNVAWHARLMVLAWGVLIPLGVIIARFGKVMPGQDWPRQLDNPTWWHSHLSLQYIAGAAMLGGLGMILMRPGEGLGATLHVFAGWTILSLAGVQFLAGWLRGTKGGPTSPAADGSYAGDHYDMTLRRKIFEHVHKTLGYLLLAAATATILSGLWITNAPVWMWLALIAWWILYVVGFVALQRRRLAVDTYQAIWGPSKTHPGNRIPPIGWGVRRVDERTVERQGEPS